jgi:hypothetical protein
MLGFSHPVHHRNKPTVEFLKPFTGLHFRGFMDRVKKTGTAVGYTLRQKLK